MRRRAGDDDVRVCLARSARATLRRLSPGRRAALADDFGHVGCELLAAAEHVVVEASWARRTWPRRRYPQQCYQKTAKYVVDHPHVDGVQLVHGVVSHAPRYLPFDHAWVELPGGIVFDGVVQAFFTRASYYAVMHAVALDRYAAADAARLIAERGHPGPWNAAWVPTTAQLEAYATVVRERQVAGGSPSMGLTVGTKR